MWYKGNARVDGCFCGDFFSNLIRLHGYNKLAKIIKVNRKTIHKYEHNKLRCSYEKLIKIIDNIFPVSTHSLPLYNINMALDGNSRVVGVGEYTLRSARGIQWD